MTGQPPRIWVLLGERRGDNNQLLGLAEALGLPLRDPDDHLWMVVVGHAELVPEAALSPDR